MKSRGTIEITNLLTFFVRWASLFLNSKNECPTCRFAARWTFVLFHLKIMTPNSQKKTTVGDFYILLS